METRDWVRLRREIVDCERCPRLRAHCRRVAEVRRRAFRNQVYWGRPVPGFGDIRARILLVGLAPAAHGANRTGRMFTGDRSGDWLYAALHHRGLATQAESVSRGDGLALSGVWVSAVNRCAPPDNLPTRAEQGRCLPFLMREVEMLADLRVVVALGGLAWHALLRVGGEKSGARRGSAATPRFGHGATTLVKLPPGDRRLPLIGSYHPSQQNTQTGRLTRPMLDAIVAQAIARAGD